MDWFNLNLTGFFPFKLEILWDGNYPLFINPIFSWLVLWHSRYSYNLQCQPHVWVPVCVPADPLPIQLSTSGLGKVADNGPSAWVRPTHARELDEGPGSSLAQGWPLWQSSKWPSSWKMCLSLSNSAFLINTQIFKKKKKIKNNYIFLQTWF